MSEVVVILDDKKYIYSEVSKLKTWRDYTGLVVPVFLHEKLREHAIKQGADESLFVTKGVVVARSINEPESAADEEFVEPKKRNRKSSLKMSINPFAK